MTITVKKLHKKLSHVNPERSLYFRTCDELMAGRIVTEYDILREYEKTFNEVTSDVNSAIAELADYRDEVQFYEIM